MKKTVIIFLALVATTISSAADNAYKILHECDTTVKAQLGGSFSFGSRLVKHFVYEYPSTDADGQEVTVSGR